MMCSMACVSNVRSSPRPGMMRRRLRNSEVGIGREEAVDDLEVTRSREEITAFFAGLDLVEPGVVPTSRWRPTEPVRDDDAGDLYAGVARKP